jgi:hypothetical protein
LACATFAIDLGYLALARSQTQNAADVAAMAAAWELLDEQRLGNAAAQQKLASQGRDVAVGYAARNNVCGSPPLLDRNASNDPQGDLVFGRFDGSSQLSTFGTLRDQNAVFVRICRTSRMNGPVSLFFAKYLGIGSAEVTAEAVATFGDGVSGFRTNSRNKTTSLAPFGVQIDAWRDLMKGAIVADNWTVDPKTNQVTAGGDGISELVFYPVTTGSAGNFGTLRVGDFTNSTVKLNRQVAQGVSEADLAFHGGEITVGPLPGDPGISAAIKDGLSQAVGKPRSIALYDTVGSVGAVSQYNIVGFAGVRVVEFRLVGVEPKIVLQPSVVVDDTAISGKSSSYTVYQPVVLAK